jgi:hypothetical protein
MVANSANPDEARKTFCDLLRFGFQLTLKKLLDREFEILFPDLP